MSTIHPITLPKWGLEMSEGTITAWHVAEGAELEKGVELVDIETEKIVNTLDLERSGTVRRLIGQPGDVLPVGALIAVLAPKSVADAEVDSFIKGYKPVDASFEPGGDKPEPKAEPAPEPAKVEAKAEPKTEAKPASKLSGDELKAANESVHATPLARRIANQHGIELSSLKGSGKNGRISQEDVEKAAGVSAASDATPPPAPKKSAEEIKAENDGVHASPIARKIANELGVSMKGLTGTGRKGRVSLGDVETKARSFGLLQDAPVAAPAASTASAARETAATSEGMVPFTAMRKAIAQALVRSKQTVPHFYTTVDIDADALLALRAQVNANPVGGGKVSVNDFILRASALALKQHPDVNVHVFDDGVKRFDQVDISVAVAIEGGLVTPVIRDAASKSVTEIGKASVSLAEKARARTLGGDDLKGATFTVSNLGMFGVREFDAIISPPQAAILAVGGTRREAREKDGGVVFVSAMSVTLSADHRAVDGAVAARFLATLKDLIEQPVTLLV
jgi:pyruvate dehydrogenase E2 component (dihydrolipoamide acetyltransferase)